MVNEANRRDPFTPDSDWRGHLAADHPDLHVPEDASYWQAAHVHAGAHVDAAFAGRPLNHYHAAPRVDRRPRYGR